MICLKSKLVCLILLTAVLLNAVYTQEDGSFWWLKVLKIQNKTAEPEHETSKDFGKEQVPSVNVTNISMERSSDDEEETSNSLYDENDGFVLPMWSQDVQKNNILLQNSGMIMDISNNAVISENVLISPSSKPAIESSAERNTTETKQLLSLNNIMEQNTPPRNNESLDSLLFLDDTETRDYTECRCMSARNCQRLRGATDNTKDGRTKTCNNGRLEYVCCNLHPRKQSQNQTVNLTTDIILAGNHAVMPMISSISSNTTVPEFSYNISNRNTSHNTTTFKPNILSKILFPRSALGWPGPVGIKQTISNIEMPVEANVINASPPVRTSELKSIKVETPATTVQPKTMNEKASESGFQHDENHAEKALHLKSLNNETCVVMRSYLKLNDSLKTFKPNAIVDSNLSSMRPTIEVETKLSNENAIKPNWIILKKETIGSTKLFNMKTPVEAVKMNLLNTTTPATIIKTKLSGERIRVSHEGKLNYPQAKEYASDTPQLEIITGKTGSKFLDRKLRFRRTILERMPRIVTDYAGQDAEPIEDPYWNIKNSNINPRLTQRNRNDSKSVNLRNELNSHGLNFSEILSEIPKPGIGGRTRPESSYNVWLKLSQNPRLIAPANKSAPIVKTAGLNSYGQTHFDYSDETNQNPGSFTLQDLLNNFGTTPKLERPIPNKLLSETVEKLAEAYLEKLLDDSGIHETTSNQLDPDFIVFQNFLPWRRRLIDRVKQEFQSIRFRDNNKNTHLFIKSPNKWTPNRTPSYEDIQDGQIKQIFTGYGQTPGDENPTSDPDDVLDPVYEDYEVEPPKTDFLNQIYTKCGILDVSSVTSPSPWLLRISVDGDGSGGRSEDRAGLTAGVRSGAPRVSCGGALIHPRAALVAAHCVVGSADGTASLRSGSGADGGAAQERRARILTHSNYRAGGTHDVALLLWRVPFNMGSGVKALCVPSAESVVTRGSSRCSALGWNNRRPVSTSARVVTTSSCGGAKTNARNPRAICADNGGSCEEDSEMEGPLMCLSGQRWYVTGLFSWRRSCSQPARYTDIAAHQAWIIDLLEDNYII